MQSWLLWYKNKAIKKKRKKGATALPEISRRRQDTKAAMIGCRADPSAAWLAD
jgi:hypothetical protein